MIEINNYCEALLEVMSAVNNRLKDAGSSDKIKEFIAVPAEPSLLKKIKDRDGILLCASYPPCDSNATDSDNVEETNSALLFLLEKVDESSMDDADERNHFAKMQRIANMVKKELQQSNFGCDKGFTTDGQIHIEWEYNYAGMNGLSLAFSLTD